MTPASSPFHDTVDLLDPGLLDRVTGVLVVQACGDALGVPYEFATPPRFEEAVMRGGGLGPYAPGEWSDDTQMAICVARVAASADLTATNATPATGTSPLDAIAAAFENWKLDGATDMGRQTAAVLRNARRLEGSPARRLREASHAMSAFPGLTASNGALMCAGVTGLVALGDRHATARAARAVAELTHDDPLATDACALWSEAVRLAVTEQRLDVEAGLDLIPAERRADWHGWIVDAASPRPSTGLRANGFCVTALQAAWHAISTTTPSNGSATGHVTAALQAAIRIGGDTDTIGAITGALLGARYGDSATPTTWRNSIHGWPGIRARELGALARAVVQREIRPPTDGQAAVPTLS